MTGCRCLWRRSFGVPCVDGVWMFDKTESNMVAGIVVGHSIYSAVNFSWNLPLQHGDGDSDGLIDIHVCCRARFQTVSSSR